MTRPFRKQAHQEHQHSLIGQRASNRPRVNVRGSTYRRNPGEMPASTLPPIHFIFHEAFLKNRFKALLYPVAPMMDDASLSRTQAPVQQQHRQQLKLENTRNQPSVEARCQVPMTSSEWPSIPAALSSSTTISSPPFSWFNSLLETLLIFDELLLLNVTNVTIGSGQEDASSRKASIVGLSPQSESISKVIASNTLEPTDAQAQDPVLSAVLAFIKCLATATTTLAQPRSSSGDLLRPHKYLHSSEPIVP